MAVARLARHPAEGFHGPVASAHQHQARLDFAWRGRLDIAYRVILVTLLRRDRLCAFRLQRCLHAYTQAEQAEDGKYLENRKSHALELLVAKRRMALCRNRSTVTYLKT